MLNAAAVLLTSYGNVPAARAAHPVCPSCSPRAVARCARCGQDRPPQARSAHYARLSDRTVREHWEKARKVNAEGQPVQVSPGGPLGDAAWSKHHLSRATQELPNGYCQLQLVKTCPHANSCFLTCPMFVTTAEFLPQHRAQRAEVGGDCLFISATLACPFASAAVMICSVA